MRAYLTPAALPLSSPGAMRFLYLADYERAALVSGALLELCQPESWEQSPGGITPDEAAEEFTQLFDDYANSDTMLTGMMVPYATTNAPGGTLPCDGSTYQRVDYPRLYAALDAAFIVDANSFNVPNMVDRVPVGAGSLVGVGGVRGSDTVSLTASQNGPHTHTYIPPVTNVDLETPGAPDIFAAGVGLPIATGGSGSGAAHENMQPSLGVRWAIVHGGL